MRKSMLAGAIAAILLVALAGLGRFAYLRMVGGAPEARGQESVLLIFESSAKDGAPSAALISVVGGGKMRDVSPDTTVAVSGTSYSRLGDALAFGGGAAVARGLGSGQHGSVMRYVSVPEPVWHAAIEATYGVRVDIPRKLAAFKGAGLTTIPSGEQTLTADQVGVLMEGLSYLSTYEVPVLRVQLERQLAAALVSAGSSRGGFDTSFSPTDLDLWLRNGLTESLRQ
jgi:hypothetical protein